MARREVARIHASRFGVDDIMKDLCRLVLAYLTAWEEEKEIPPGFLEALFAQHEPYRLHYEAGAQQERFTLELQSLFSLVAAAQEADRPQGESGPDPVLTQLEDRLLQIAPAYGLDLTRPEQPVQATPAHAMQADIQDLFRFVQQQGAEVAPDADFSAALFLQSVIALVAEYTEGFNNDEIRSIFQEARMEHQLEGQLITPRYLGMKIGIIRHRRDERSVVHLDTERGRR
jgi:hypothetical protein